MSDEGLYDEVYMHGAAWLDEIAAESALPDLADRAQLTVLGSHVDAERARLDELEARIDRLERQLAARNPTSRTTMIRDGCEPGDWR